MATVEKELSVPRQVREKAANAAGYRDHARQLRRDYDSGAQERESNHQRLIASGVGPCDSAEVLRLQKSRWQVLADNEKALDALVKELGEIRQHLADDYQACKQMLEQHRLDEIRRLVDDHGMKEHLAATSVDADRMLASLRQIGEDIRKHADSIRQMIQACEQDAETINATRAKLSRQWRAF